MTKMKFDAKVPKILHLMIHSLYKNSEIFLRELISNASDAIDKLKYLSQMNIQLQRAIQDYRITIRLDKPNKKIMIIDNGIGMNKEDIMNNLGTIASSGTQDFLEELIASGKKEPSMELIGQFGVGFYSAYIVANKVEVISRKAGEDQSWFWMSDGTDEYIVEESDIEVHGTMITLYIKDGQEIYFDKFRVEHVIKTYSDHISVPIYLEYFDENTNNMESKLVNSSNALWTKSKSDITDEKYQEFYKNIAYSPDKPWLILHNHNEGMINFINLLFIPSAKPFDLFHPDRKVRVKLYVKKVFITEEDAKLVPQFLRFVKGVVDSNDLPLNINRETLQHNAMIDKIRKVITKKILAEFSKKMSEDSEDYNKFWNNFGSVIKEGLCDATEDRESILKICKFHSSETSDLITLAEYIENMQPDQKEIYYITGDNLDQMKNSPQIEGFKDKGIEVLLLIDPVDDFWVNVLHEHKGYELKSVTRTNINLDDEEGQKDVNSTKDNEDNNISDTLNFEEIISFFKETLKTAVADVKKSNKLTKSPVCLAVQEGAMDMRMEKFLIEQKQISSSSTKVLEINAQHPIIKYIYDNININKSLAEDLVWILFDQANIIEGQPIKDAVLFSNKINDLILNLKNN